MFIVLKSIVSYSFGVVKQLDYYNDDRKIMNELKRDHAVSFRKIFLLILIPYFTIYYVLMNHIHFRYLRLKWFPRIQNENKKKMHV